MGKDYEILEEQYQKLVADKAAAEGRTDLSDEERANTIAGFDKAIAGLESSILELANKAKDEIMAAIKDIEDKIQANKEFLEKAEARKAELQAEIDAETEKGEAGDKDKIRIYQSEIDGINKDIKKVPSERTMNRKITEQRKKLIPLMNMFKDKGVFTQEEIDTLTKLEKRIERAKKKVEPKEEPTTPGGDGTTTPGGDGTTTPGGDGTTTPGGDGTTTPGGDGTTTPGGDGTTTPGGDGTTTPGGDGTTTPGGTTTTTPGGTTTTTPGGTTTTTPKAPADPRDMSIAEFEEIYRAAKIRALGVKDIEKLQVIMSDPTCYEKFGISTGLFRNKAKVLLVAMGSRMTDKYPNELKAMKDVFGIDAKTEQGDNIVPTSEVRSWGGIKRFLDKKELKTKGQSVFEKVVAAADEKVAAGEALTADEQTLRDRAAAELETMSGFRTALATYSDVKRTRNRNPLSWFTGLGRALTLPAGNDDARDTSVEDGVRADVERAGREATAGLSDTARDAMIIAALSSESERSSKKLPEPVVGGDGTPEVTETTEVKTMAETLEAGVYPPEEIDATAGEKVVSEVVEIDTFDGPGIDG